MCVLYMLTIVPVSHVCIVYVDVDNSIIIELGSGEEIEYIKMLNKVLPAEVRVLAWCPVTADFSARCAHHVVHIRLSLTALGQQTLNV